MSDYKTPWIDVGGQAPVAFEEVSTSIPAFVGFTEKTNREPGQPPSPLRIETFIEYEENFGGPACSKFKVEVDRDGVKNIEVTSLPYLMYYSISMYFKNGGGSCYIVSVGEYGSSQINNEDMIAGIDSLLKEQEPALLVLADGPVMFPKDFYDLCQYAMQHCERVGNRFCILDTLSGPSSVKDFRNNTGTGTMLRHAAAYYPWIRTTHIHKYEDESVTVNFIDYASGTVSESLLNQVEDAEIYNLVTRALDSEFVVIPPSGPVAGIYARVDRERGAWSPPANETIKSVIGPFVELSISDDDFLRIAPDTGKSINPIRVIPGKGVSVWGVRTLAGNDNEWRYISVRRMFNLVETFSKKSTQFAVFEPNNSMTWLKVRTIISGFLDDLWMTGGLAGESAEQAYYVNASLGTTMTEQDINDGLIKVEVGMAPLKPAEFLVIRFAHEMEKG